MRTTTVCLIVLFGASALARAGANLSPEALLPAHENGDAHRPGAAFGKDVFLVVWQAGMMQETNLVACRVDRSGRALDAKPFVVSDAPDSQERPRVAFGGGIFLVVWQDIRNGKDYDTYAARVSPEGKLLDAKGVLVAGGAGNQSRPRIAFDGRTFFVAWEDRRDGKCYEIYGARVSPAGRVLDAGGARLVGLKDEKEKGMFDRSMPAVASLGDGRTLLVWCGTKYWVGWGTAAGSVFVRDGKVEKDNGDLQGIKDRNGGIGGGGRGGTPVSAAAGKEGYLVLWRNHRPVGRAGGGGRSNCALFVDKDGNWKKGETLSLSGAPHIAMGPEAAWDGSGFVAAWGDQSVVKRNHGTFDHVVAARTDAKGAPAGGAIPVAGTFEAPAARPCVASDGAGTTLVAYERHPKTGDVPIKIGFRLLRAPASAGTSTATGEAARSAGTGPAAAEPKPVVTPPAAPAREPVAAKPPTPEEICRGWWSLAMSYQRAGRKDKAREYFQKIVDEHPGTEYAARARKELAAL